MRERPAISQPAGCAASEVTTTTATPAAAARATYLAFIFAGFAFASWASRIPQVRDRLHLSPAELGFVLLSIACGSLLALPLAGTIIDRVGSRRTIRAVAIATGIAIAAIAAGYLLGVAPVVAGLFVFGFAAGLWDVAMNVQAALVERRLGSSIMSRFHAGFSVGTVAGAVIGAAMVALHVPVTAHLAVVALAVAVVVPLAVRDFFDDHAAHTPTAAGIEAGDPPPRVERGSALARWREPRTLVIGLFVLSFAFAEGAGNDWISVALIDGYGTSAALGTLAFALFLSAMTGARWYGPGLLDRYGRVVVARVLALVGIAGIVLFVFSPTTPLAFVGAALWGTGAALGFPLGMSAASDEPVAAAGRVSVVSSIGYCAFLAGPPLIGFVGDRTSVLRALMIVGSLFGVAALIAGSVRAPADSG
jgi:predicted MFS family arabinose efflux permease